MLTDVGMYALLRCSKYGIHTIHVCVQREPPEKLFNFFPPPNWLVVHSAHTVIPLLDFLII